MDIIDMHCDTISRILEHRRRGERIGLRENNLHADLTRMRGSGYLLQNFALFVDAGKCGGDPWKEVCELHRVYEEEMRDNADLIAPVYKYADIARNQEAGKLSALLTVEEGGVCRGEIGKLEQLYDMGVRMLTLTWNYQNELGYPNLNRENGDRFLLMPDTENGLTGPGREFVQRMDELGMIADVSHLSDAGFYDVLQYGRKPFVASHSNARAVCGCVRNLTDDMIRKLSERGGCMGLNFCEDFLELPDERTADGMIAAVVRHAKHIVDAGGIDVLGLGSDFDGIDTNSELQGVQSMGLLWEALHKAGFTQSALDRIFSGNVRRVYREVLG